MGIDASQLPMFVATDAPRKTARLPRGRGLESLIKASQYGVMLTKVPSGVQWLPGGRVAPIRAPADFFGMYLPTHRLIVLDAKECKLKTRLDTQEEHFAEHQREQLVSYGQLGAISGLLVEATALLRLHWVPWWMLSPRRASYQWAELVDVGPSNLVISAERWGTIVSATDARPEGAQTP